MLDLNRRTCDIAPLTCARSDTWIIAALAAFGIKGERRGRPIGIWVARPDEPRGAGGEMAEDKIAAISIRVRRWIAFHGIALNVAPNLTHWRDRAVRDFSRHITGVTSLQAISGVRAEHERGRCRAAKHRAVWRTRRMKEWLVQVTLLGAVAFAR